MSTFPLPTRVVERLILCSDMTRLRYVYDIFPLAWLSDGRRFRSSLCIPGTMQSDMWIRLDVNVGMSSTERCHDPDVAWS